MVESGLFYSTFIDPLLVKMREKVGTQISENENVVDIACGTGAQVFELAKKSKFVTGVDLSASMIKRANQTKNKTRVENVNFSICDATNLKIFTSKEFDVATMSLALHQFPPALYTPVLNEMKRISRRIIIVDYSVPLPQSIVGYGSRLAEFMAGKEHHGNFRKFYKNGGLESILKKNDISIEKSFYFAGNVFQLIVGSESTK